MDLRSVFPLQLPKGAQILALDLSELQLSGAQRVAQVARLIEEIRHVWNPLVLGGVGVGAKDVRKGMMNIVITRWCPIVR